MSKPDAEYRTVPTCRTCEHRLHKQTNLSMFDVTSGHFETMYRFACIDCDQWGPWRRTENEAWVEYYRKLEE